MKTFFLTGIAAATTLLAAPTLARQSDDSGRPAKEKKVCRSERPTGSYITKRTCHTRAEWKAIDGSNADNANTMMDRARHSRFGETQ